MAKSQKANPIDEFFEMCKDVDGSLHPEKVRYALAYAYRYGFLECKDFYRSRMAYDPECSVSRPEPVFTEAERKFREDEVRARLVAEGILREAK